MSRTTIAAVVFGLSVLTVTAALGQPPQTPSAVRGPELAPGPAAAPGARVWTAVPLPSPNRHIGPFCGSDLNAIKLRLDGMRAQLYFTRFLTTHPSGPYVQRYLPTGFTPPPLPPDVPGSGAPPRYVPGQYPTANGFHDLQLALSCIRYSGRYGGSVELIFRSEEHFEYEARQGSILWDLRDVEVSQFIVPDYRRFNSGPGIGTEPIHLEIRWGGVIAYRLGATAITVEADAHRADFDTLWATFLTGNIATPSDQFFRAPTLALMYGFIHELFRTQVSGTTRVSMLELDENYLSMRTTAGVAMVVFVARISYIDLTVLPIEGHSYFQVTATASWDSQLTRTRVFDIEGRTATGYEYFFVFPLLPVCSGTSPSINVSAKSREAYPLITRDTDVTGLPSPAVDCAGLQSAVTAGNWGLQGTRTTTLREGTNGDGTLSVEMGFLLQNH